MLEMTREEIKGLHSRYENIKSRSEYPDLLSDMDIAIQQLLRERERLEAALRSIRNSANGVLPEEQDPEERVHGLGASAGDLTP